MRKASNRRIKSCTPVCRTVVACVLACGFPNLSDIATIRADEKPLPKTVERAPRKTAAAKETAAKGRDKGKDQDQESFAARHAAATAAALRAAANALFGSNAAGRRGGFALVPGRPNAIPAEARKSLQARLMNVVHRELYFIHKCCELSPDQWRQLLASGEQSVEECLNQSTTDSSGIGVNTVMVQLRTGNDIRSIQIPKNTIPQLRKGLSQQATKLLNRDQVAKLEQELKDRDEFRRRASVTMTVATIDRKVGLSTEQADQLIAAILPDWNDREDSAMVLQETEMIPQIPNSVVTKIFTDTQMRIWNLLPKSPTNRVTYLAMYDAFDEHEFDLSLLDPRFSKKTAPGKSTGANQPSPKTPVPAP